MTLSFLYEYPLAVVFFLGQYIISVGFILVALSLALIILFLQGKGDMGVVGAWQGGQMVFGGSGGQDFISKLVWVLGFAFLFLSLLVAKVEVRGKHKSVFNNYSIFKKVEAAKVDVAESSDVDSSDDVVDGVDLGAVEDLGGLDELMDKASGSIESETSVGAELEDQEEVDEE